MRIEFEAVMAKQLSSEGYSDFSVEMMFERGSNDEYRSIRVNGAYWGWQASRESLVVKLPDPVDYPDGCGDVYEAIDPDQLIEAIHSAGIRTK